jgi:hypothetical protein
MPRVKVIVLVGDNLKKTMEKEVLGSRWCATGM